MPDLNEYKRRGLSGPTLKDIAEQAEVSIGTVSVILNDKPRAARYSEATRQRVRAIAEELGYVGTPLGRVLRSKTSGTLGIICFNQPDIFSSHLLFSAQEEIEALGYLPVTTSMHYDTSRFEDCLYQLSQWRVEGMLIMMAGRPLRNDLLERIAGNGVPYIALDNRAQERPLALALDHESGALAGAHLCTLGHEEVAVLGFNPSTAHAHDRLAGLRAGLGEHAARLTAPRIFKMPKQCFGAEAGYQCAQSLLQSGERVTAAVCMNDLIALGALRACADRGVKVPADLSVIGFDDICLGSNAAETNRLGGYTKPRLTTVRLPHPQIGRDVARRLVTLVREGAEERHENVDITPTLVTRESTVPVHAGGGA